MNATPDLAVGDVISSRGTPYRIAYKTTPAYVERSVGTLIVRAWPVYTIGLSLVDRVDRAGNINDIRQVGDRWWTDSNSEIVLVERGAPPPEPPRQLGLFDAPPAPPAAAEPYLFDPTVIYGDLSAGPADIWTWRCETCARDWNGERGRWAPRCPAGCIYNTQRVLVMPPRPEPPAKVAWALITNSYLMSINSGSL